MKVIVAGSRIMRNYSLLREKLDYYLQHYREVEIVSGGGTGADALGERYAQERGLGVKRFKADWTTHGKAAELKRNQEMVKYADACIVFWNGKSPGARSMIELARKYSIKPKVVHI